MENCRKIFRKFEDDIWFKINNETSAQVYNQVCDAVNHPICEQVWNRVHFHIFSQLKGIQMW